MHFAACYGNEFGKLVANICVIDNAGIRHPDPFVYIEVRFYPPRLIAADVADCSKTVAYAALIQLIELACFTLICGYDELSAEFIADAIFIAELKQHFIAVDAMFGLQTAWLVVD